MTVRHAREHDIYVLETDGYLLDRFKAYYAGGYGVLTFVEDHGADAELRRRRQRRLRPLPGLGRRLDRQPVPDVLPEVPLQPGVPAAATATTTPAASPGTDSHGTLITHNNFYDNALGFTTDVFTAPGHPGFPQHGNVDRGQQLLLQQLQPVRRGLGRRPVHPGAGRHRPVAGRRQRQRRAGTTTSTTTGAAARCCSPSPTPRSAARDRRHDAGARAATPAGTRPRTATTSTATPWASARRARCSPTAPTSGGTASRATPATAGGATTRRPARA